MGKLDAFLARAIQAHANRNSQHLGDRNNYIGASDIAGCPRKAVMTRLKPKAHTFATMLRFAWGHVAQSLFRDIFIAGGMKPGENFTEEVELVHPNNPRVKCHIDFLFESGQRFHVVEKKCTKNLPNEAYGSWINQLHVQMGMLKRDPRSNGKRIGGSILATEPLPREDADNDQPGYKEYNSFEPDDLIFDHLMKKAEHILNCIDGKEKPVCEPSLLCGTCQYSQDCPTRRAVIVNIPSEILEIANNHEDLTAQKRKLDGLIDELREKIIDFTGKAFVGEQGNTILEVQYFKGREYVDPNVLKNKYPLAYEGSVRKSKGWSKVTVRTKESKAA